MNTLFSVFVGVLAILVLYIVYMILTLMFMIIYKPIYSGYLNSQGKTWSKSEEIDFDLKCLDMTLLPLSFTYKCVSYFPYKLGYYVGTCLGKRKNSSA